MSLISSSSRRANVTLILCLGIAAVALSLYATQYAIDFFVYYSISNSVFSQEGALYGTESGVPWPMYYRYPPLLLFLVFPFVFLPFPVATVIWTLLKSGACVLVVRALVLRLEDSGRSPGWLLAACIAGPYIVMEARYGNVQFFIFALVVWALLSLPGHPHRAAGALGLAAGLKVWPLFFLPYLMVRGHKRTAAWTLLVAFALSLLPALHFGWSRNLALLQQWWDQESEIVAQAHQIWFPSQSLHGLLTRYLSDVDYQVAADPNYPVINIASLEPQTVYALWLIGAAVAYLALLRLAAKAPGHLKLEAHGVAFCALVLLQPYSQKQTALVVLVWPALVAAAGLRRALPSWGRIVIYLAAALGLLQTVLPTPFAHRLFQVLGTDALLTSLLIVGLLSRWLVGNKVELTDKATREAVQADQPR